MEHSLPNFTSSGMALMAVSLLLLKQ